jgi:hypothetical protein
MNMRTIRQSAAFPTVAILRKGGPKAVREGKEVFGPDLNDRFRVDWLPGVDTATKELFLGIYQTDQPHSLRAMIAFPSVWQSWSTTNEAYWGSTRFAQADNERYLSLYNPFTWEALIMRGEPFKPFIPGEMLTFADKQGQPKAFKLRPTTRFDLFLPELVGCFVTFQIKTKSAGDLTNLRRNLAAIQSAAEALGQRTGAAGIPIVVSRREDTVQWHKAPGQTVPVKKWLIDVRPDPASKWAQTFAERLGALALAMPLTVEEDPAQDEDLFEDGEEDNGRPAALAGQAPTPPPSPGAAHGEAQADANGAAPDALAPKGPKDWTTFWKVSVPGLGVSQEQAQKAAKGLDALAAYRALRQAV